MIKEVFDKQKDFSLQLRLTKAKARIAFLRKLKLSIQENEEAIYQALAYDLGKNRFEAAVTEVLFSYAEIDFAIKKLLRWMKPQRADKTFSSYFAKNRIYYEPRGVCLIISPWNYPFQLTVSPLVSAIAAGNTAIIKPSELSSATSRIITKIIDTAFKNHHVCCFEGDASMAQTLLGLPFDHIFYTGSTAVGKIIMNAAAKNLSSVTLELGGKSPTLIDEAVDLEKAVQKIVWGKLINAGQTCIAPDYTLIPEKRVDEFIGLFQKYCKAQFFNSKGELNKNVYGKIINPKHFIRLKTLIDNAIEKGGRISWGGKMDEQQLLMYPVLLTQLSKDCLAMSDEIFGPILPIIPYTDLQDAIHFINQKPKPLALYLFSKHKKNIQKVIKSTSSGGVCVNDILIQIANPNLPFGGVGHSGMGNCHGFYGFKTFSHERSVVIQGKPDFSTLIYPPYQKKSWVLKLLRKLM